MHAREPPKNVILPSSIISTPIDDCWKSAELTGGSKLQGQASLVSYWAEATAIVQVSIRTNLVPTMQDHNGSEERQDRICSGTKITCLSLSILMVGLL